ncbi:hypothetical protein IEQ34_001366 [Dendrobium chrysotoxum]|uniref:Uncharacterized protein n=1 Tax=Dendrobium chrysotoxum TaxID=161865 RepID=A0AAV7HQC6_DENCH|nr:hypothetical protein IEQ34_001366 [Dendrobium chrysotoxum]
MEFHPDKRCYDYYEKDRIVLEEPQYHRHQHYRHNLFNDNHHGDTSRFKEERRFEDNSGHGGHFAGDERRVVTYKVERIGYLVDDGGKDGGYYRE